MLHAVAGAYRDEIDALRLRAEAAEAEVERLRGGGARAAGPEVPADLAPHLRGGAPLRWTGRPGVLRLAWLPLPIVPVLVAGAVLYFLRDSRTTAVVLVVVALLLLRRLLVAYRTLYAIVGTELILLRAGEVRRIDLRRIAQVRTRLRNGGSGDLILSTASARPERVRLVGIEDVGGVEQIVRSIRQEEAAA